MNQSDMTDLKILALIHDIGECLLGNRILEKKDEISQKDEQKAGEQLIDYIFENPEQQINLKNIYAIGFSLEHRLYKYFKSFEIMSYISGAIQALQQKDTIEHPDILIYKVLIYQIPKIKELIENGDIGMIAFYKDHSFEIQSLFSYINRGNTNKSDEEWGKIKRMWADMVVWQKKHS